MVYALRPIAVAGAVAVLAGMLVGAAFAQTPSSAAPEFRDPTTGKVWTPYNVSQDDKLTRAPAISNQDRAFNPQAQNVVVDGVTVQRPRAQLMGTMPVTAGPSVPLVTLDRASLLAVPGERWITALYVTNNSADMVNTVVGCLFTNAGRKVEDTRIVVPPAGPGERLALQVYGPRVDIFVDRVTCQILAPI